MFPNVPARQTDWAAGRCNEVEHIVLWHKTKGDCSCKLLCFSHCSGAFVAAAERAGVQVPGEGHRNQGAPVTELGAIWFRQAGQAGAG